MRNATSHLWSCCAIAVLATAGLATQANAVSLRVKLACSSDYRALCSQYASDSPEVRACMRAAGERLSPRCLNALIAAGEVSQEEVARRAAQAHQ
ncbi:conserved exported hypothetical protein [Hyphomicrobium sp. GJ21]|uniref:hypothetical protein n=1 Tax=Hyphomicrobium sp. GJ21 TaxID=113574 RepID=UPI000622B99B|nr:hypothetical protein [Hyphomicrobium sp. GJ21]CEJ83890.1 conserved exported hypothetical protein [Hyphomicrobium sp. GJ21]